jgi:hypothetical protein
LFVLVPFIQLSIVVSFLPESKSLDLTNWNHERLLPSTCPYLPFGNARHILSMLHGGGMATYKPCSILPALAFSLDMFSQTDMSYGVNEVLLASVLGSVVFALAAAQPLVIVGVTGT